jgi:hypothetical protein
MLILLSASNNDKKPKIENLVILLEDVENKKDRNVAIVKEDRCQVMLML